MEREKEGVRKGAQLGFQCTLWNFYGLFLPNSVLWDLKCTLHLSYLIVYNDRRCS